MTSRLRCSLILLFLMVFACTTTMPSMAQAASATPAEVSQAQPKPAAQVKVMSIPVREGIDDPVLYILRRGLKQAIEGKYDAVVLDMETPGGSLATTFEILKALEKFEGLTITYINREAISAGALISAGTHEIWFAPQGVIGAAAPVMSGGKDIDVTMKEKIVSYLKARVRSISEGKGYRGEVISAMIDADEELKIGDKVIKAKGKLLSLTATEAVAMYGEPPQKLLGEGVANTLDALLESKYGRGGYQLTKLEASWSENLAVMLNGITPILLGLGLLALFIEFKTPGFGFFGISGIILLAVVFLSNYVAGLSGHEPILVFVLGLLLVLLELFFFPGIVVVAMTGLVLMIGSLVWSMTDLWPNQPLTITTDLVVQPIASVGLGLLVAMALGVVVVRFLPKGWLWDRMIVSSVVEGAAQSSGSAPAEETVISSLIGATGVAVSALRPSGQVEIGGHRYEARVEVGIVEPGEPIVVRARSDFGLVVEKA